MNTEQLIAHGNQCREQHNPEGALAYYTQAMTQDRGSSGAFNNYGNVLREMGEPLGAIPFLQRAIQLDPNGVTAQFNLAVAYLLSGDYARGWPQYESRWKYEHLAGTLPKYEQPRWVGQDLAGKTILVLGEQGHGDNIQFIRFVGDLVAKGGRVIVAINDSLIPLFQNITAIAGIYGPEQILPPFDYWTPIMSIPGIIGCTLDNLSHVQSYLKADENLARQWQQTLGLKKRLRVGFCWSGRRDTWINQHKAIPFETMLALIRRNPGYEWINLQVDCTADEEKQLIEVGVQAYPGAIKHFADTAALIHHMDVVLSVDTAVGHLSGSLGRPTWIMLNQYGLDWRWLLDRDNSPWYSTATLFRQPKMGDWNSVTEKIHKYLGWYKI
jgi:tetratricopeptide (TPR) repeat protein